MAGPQESVQRGIRVLADVAMRGWFREREVRGVHQLLRDRPLVVVATHANGFVDPALLYATSPRPLRFLAKATLWKTPPIGLLLDAAGAVPVHRAQDGATEANRSTFSSCHEVLRRDGAIAIFPEGTVTDEPRIGHVHTGAARIALGARASGVAGLLIVPVGLVYEDKTRPRTRALVRVGEPIDLDAEITTIVEPGGSGGEDDQGAVRRLTAAVRDALRAVALDYEDESDLADLAFAAQVQQRRSDQDPRTEVPVAAYEPVMHLLARAPAGQLDIVLAAAEAYRTELELLDVDDAVVAPGDPLPQLRDRVTRRLLKLSLLAAPASLGLVLNGATLVGLRRLWRRPMAQVSRANFGLLTSLVAFPLTWLLWGVAFRLSGWRHPWRRALLGGPLTGHAAVVWWETAGRFRRARLDAGQLARHAELLDEIRHRRQSLVDAVDAALAATDDRAA